MSACQSREPSWLRVRAVMRASAAHNVLLELLDTDFLFGDDGLDQIPDRYNTPHVVLVEHGELADPVCRHQRHTRTGSFHTRSFCRPPRAGLPLQQRQRHPQPGAAARANERVRWALAARGHGERPDAGDVALCIRGTSAMAPIGAALVDVDGL